MRVDKLENDLLNYWFAKTEGLTIVENENGPGYWFYKPCDCNCEVKLDWNFTGPIMERLIKEGWEFSVEPFHNYTDICFDWGHLQDSDFKRIRTEYKDNDLLAAIKCCRIKMKYGETVKNV